jgi:spore coat protein A, manganese oxidase
MGGTELAIARFGRLAMKLTRREALKLGLAGTGTLLSPLLLPESAQAAAEPPPCEHGNCMSEEADPAQQTDQPSPKIQPFVQALPIPTAMPKLTKTYNNGMEIDYYEITMRKAPIELAPATPESPAITAEFWTYNGMIPGPLIRQEKFRESCVRFINQLDQDTEKKPICTSVHLHGMASLPQYDGYADDLTFPGYYKDYYYPNNRASILWYHDHALHKTSRNVYQGLAGMYIVEYATEDFCDNPETIPLPSGPFEIPLVLQDKAFKIPNPKKQHEWELVFNDRRERGVYADLMLVNGKPWPFLKVQRRKYYFRVLNASASRTYQLTLSNTEEGFPENPNDLTLTGQPPQMMVIGSDAGLLDHKVVLSGPREPLRMGVAERYGIVIDFAQFGPDVKHIYLRNLPFAGNLGPTFPALMRFDLEDGVVNDPSSIPENLGILTKRDELTQRAVGPVRRFRFGRGRDWTINGKTWNRAFVAAKPKLCETEIWELENTGGWTHPVHIHLIDFQIISRNGREPLPYERGWKDVVLLSDFERVLVVARFAPHRGKYMIHCHNIVHEDHDMMTQFEVIGNDKDGNPIVPPDPCSEPAQMLPAPPLGSKTPPSQLPTNLSAKCCEVLPATNVCNVAPPGQCDLP